MPTGQIEGDRGTVAPQRLGASFWLFTAMTCLPTTGRVMQRTATGWLVWQTSHSAAWLGTIVLAELLPTVVLSPIAGYVSDLWDKKYVIAMSQLVGFLQALTLFLASVFLVSIPTTLFIVIAVALGFTNSFFLPARLALVKNIVAHNNLPAAASITSVVGNLAVSVGPMIAGFLINGTSVSTVFALATMCFLPVSLILPLVSTVTIDPPLLRTNPIYGTAAGLLYAAREPVVLIMLLALGIASLGGRSMVDLLPTISSALLGKGPEGLAWMTSMAGVGAIAGGLWIGKRGGLVRLDHIVVSHLVTSAAAILVLSYSATYLVSLAAVFIAGISFGINSVGAQAVIQSSSDPAFSGRVMGVFIMLFQGTPAIGTFLMGLATKSLGLRGALFVGGVICLGGWAALAISERRIRSTV